MHTIRGARYRLEPSFTATRFIGYFVIMSILTLAVVITSCGIIPGGKESDAVVKQFMQAAAAKDIDTACTLFPSPVEEALRTDVEELILGHYQLFEGYQDVKMRSINVQMGELHDTAEYSGEVIYTGDLKGWVDAELVKLGEEWKLTWINVEVSQEKLADYERRHGSS